MVQEIRIIENSFYGNKERNVMDFHKMLKSRITESFQRNEEFSRMCVTFKFVCDKNESVRYLEFYTSPRATKMKCVEKPWGKKICKVKYPKSFKTNDIQLCLDEFVTSVNDLLSKSVNIEAAVKKKEAIKKSAVERNKEVFFKEMTEGE